MAKNKKVIADLKSATAIPVELVITDEDRAASKAGMEAIQTRREGEDKLVKSVPALVAMAVRHGYTKSTDLLAPVMPNSKRSGKTGRSTLESPERWFNLQKLVCCGLSEEHQFLLLTETDEGLSSMERALKSVFQVDRQHLINAMRDFMERREKPATDGARNAKKSTTDFCAQGNAKAIARIQNNKDFDFDAEAVLALYRKINALLKVKLPADVGQQEAEQRLRDSAKK